MRKISTHRFLQGKGLHRISRLLLASGLPRVVQHMIGQGRFAIISAHNTPANAEYQVQGKGRVHPENRERMAHLKDILKEKGIGFIQMQGAWANDELARFIEEDSLFVPGIDENTARRIAQVFNQDSYIFGENGHYWIKATESGDVYQEGDTKEHFRLFGEEDEPEFGYSRIKNRDWILDQKQPERMHGLREEILEEAPQVMASVSRPWTWAFQCYPKTVKGATNEGIIRVVTKKDAPAGHLLAAYLPLQEK